MSAMTADTANNTTFTARNPAFVLLPPLMDWTTKSEFVPKSIMRAVETKKLVKSAYFPNSFTDNARAIAVKKMNPKMAFIMLPAPTKEMLKKDRVFMSK